MSFRTVAAILAALIVAFWPPVPAQAAAPPDELKQLDADAAAFDVWFDGTGDGVEAALALLDGKGTDAKKLAKAQKRLAKLEKKLQKSLDETGKWSKERVAAAPSYVRKARGWGRYAHKKVSAMRAAKDAAQLRSLSTQLMRRLMRKARTQWRAERARRAKAYRRALNQKLKLGKKKLRQQKRQQRQRKRRLKRHAERWRKRMRAWMRRMKRWSKRSGQEKYAQRLDVWQTSRDAALKAIAGSKDDAAALESLDELEAGVEPAPTDG